MYGTSSLPPYLYYVLPDGAVYSVHVETKAVAQVWDAKTRMIVNRPVDAFLANTVLTSRTFPYKSLESAMAASARTPSAPSPQSCPPNASCRSVAPPIPTGVPGQPVSMEQDRAERPAEKPSWNYAVVGALAVLAFVFYTARKE